MARRADIFTTQALKVGLCVVFSIAVASVCASGWAKGPADAFKGRIALSTSSFPARFSSDDSFIKYIRKVDSRELFASKPDAGWDLHYMAFFAQPLMLSQYLVLFYDVTDPQAPILLTQTTSYPEQKGRRIMAGFFELTPDLFKPDRKYLILYAANADDAALAEAEFVLRAHDPARAEAARVKAAEEARKAEGAAEDDQDKKKMPSKFDLDESGF